jgi:hypothetical protein
MKLDVPQINLISAWIGILLGFLSGLAMGLCFHRDDWLGGYGSFRRRLYRLGHISFFGLAATNFFFYVTAQNLPVGNALVFASRAFIIGAVSMPVCCVLMAHFRRAQMLFAIPVLSLATGALLTLMELVRL